MIDAYIAVDVETTGLSPVRDRLLEIGAARVQGGRVCATYGTLIDTGLPIPERITELTGITDEMQQGGKGADQAIREFLAFCGELPLLGHNISFDFSFLSQAAANRGLSFERDAFDTLQIARRVLPELPSRTLPALCAFFQVDPGRSHRALSDALAAHEIFLRLYQEFGERDPEAFRLQPMHYQSKKQSPITASQKRYLNDLLKYHKIKPNILIEGMTRNEASRMIDRILSQYGRIVR